MDRKEHMTIRPMRPQEIEMAVDWAAGEGWNPGFQDAACFAAVDPEGFLVGEIDGSAAAIISTVNYDRNFAFLGFYIVRPDLRGLGLGWQIWQAGIAHAGSRVIGLDGVVAQQDNYRKSGFTLAYRNIRYGGLVGSSAEHGEAIPLGEVAMDLLVADDALVFPADRPQFIATWTTAPGHTGRAVMHNRRLMGWGIIRPCRKGYKIGPLIADDPQTANVLFKALTGAVGGGEVFLDIPQPNKAAVALAEGHGLAPVFETARMYTGAIRGLQLDRIYGVTTFELG
jgi:ribosomal protein S18 acetylase RimI-like enzyme